MTIRTIHVSRQMLAVLALCCAAWPRPLLAQEQKELANISLEDLAKMEISVSSFARKDEDLWKTPAAVFVISREDIARSAATSIPELLRMVPGLQVAQIDASNWAVSARGFNSVYASKLLVLIDGRTVYTEIYSGAHWDQIDLPLESIERIEVIRGPGAAVWGANAVNGVINIISKAVHGTQGVLTTGQVGRLSSSATVGFGGLLGSSARYRAYGRMLDRRPFELATHNNAFDGETVWSTGGRIDWQKTSTDRITTTADLYRGSLKSQLLAEIPLPNVVVGMEDERTSGGHLLSRWERRSGTTDRALQLYYDEQSRFELSTLSRTRTLDADYQEHLPLNRRHDLVWGGEARFTADHIDGTVVSTTQPNYRNYLVDGFLQDEISLLPDRLILTVGSKVQMGTLAGFQVQPSLRILYAPDRKQSFWAAVSRAAVAPSIQDRYVMIPLVLGLLDGYVLNGLLKGDPTFKPETVIAYEAGFRRRITPTFTLDVAMFFNQNNRIQSLAAGAPTFSEGPVPVATVPFRYTNGFRARTGGIENSLVWKPRPTLSFQAGYTWMQGRTTQVDPGLVAIADAWNSPRNSTFAVASWSFHRSWSLNGFLSREGALAPSVVFAVDPTQAEGNSVPAYTRLDLHLMRRMGRMEINAGGTNLLSPRHLEFGSGTGFITPSYVPRGLYLKGTLIF